VARGVPRRTCSRNWRRGSAAPVAEPDDEPKQYRVLFQPEAIEGTQDAFLWIQSHSPKTAAEWRAGMYAAVRSLSTFPGRCPLAPEDPHFDVEIRQLLYGKRNAVYRILFTILEDEDTVSVLHVHHSAQRRLLPERPEAD